MSAGFIIVMTILTLYALAAWAGSWGMDHREEIEQYLAECKADKNENKS